jgi:hypothetical protein
MHHPLSAATRQAFQERIADHVTAIMAAARDLQAAATADRGRDPDQATVDVPVLMNIEVALPRPGATVLHVPLDPAGCPAGTSPFIITYVGGHFATGEPYYVQDVFCA